MKKYIYLLIFLSISAIGYSQSCNTLVVTNQTVTNLGNNTATVTFSLDAVSTDVIEYWVTFVNSIGYNSTLAVPDGQLSFNPTNNYEIVLNGLEAGTYYRLMVRKKCNQQLSNFSNVSFFTTLGTINCNKPLNVIASTITENSAIIFSNIIQSEPDGLQYFISTSPIPPTAGTAVSQGANPSTTIQNLMSGTTYYVWIASICNANSLSSLSNVFTFKTLPATSTCNTPTGVTIANVSQNYFESSWNVPTTIPSNGYDIYYSTSSTNPTSTTVATYSSSNGNIGGYSTDSLIANTQYFFWIRAKCSATSTSDWSAVNSFTTLASAPTCNFPTNIAISSITQTTALLSWNASIPAPGLGFGYDYYISTSATSPTATTSATASASGITSLTLNDLVANTTYYLWMRTNCSATSSSTWSAVNSFMTLPVSNSCQAVLAGSIGANSITTTGANVFWIAPASAPANGYDINISTTNVAPVGTVNTTYTI